MPLLNKKETTNKSLVSRTYIELQINNKKATQ